jgi:methyltransferase (TIGR00027 family)
MFRAAHPLLDDPPKIFADTFALRFCGCENEAALRVQLDRLAKEIAQKTSHDLARITLRYLRAVVVTRSRYVEDQLDRAIKRGVPQYVILGAGLDSFAYRRLDVAKELRVFEIDHPATQASMLAEMSVSRGTDTRLATEGYIVRGLLDDSLPSRPTS